MQQLLDVKERMKSVEGIRGVCQTLSTVAAAKLSKTRDRALASRDYVAVLRAMTSRQQLAARQAGIEASALSPLMAVRAEGDVLAFVIGADRGLCGAYNVSLVRYARDFVSELRDRGVTVYPIVIGARAQHVFRRLGMFFQEGPEWTRGGVTDALVDELLGKALEAFEAGEVAEVWAVYTEFLSVIRREPQAMRLLPIAAEQTEDASAGARWFYDPSQGASVSELLEALVRRQVEDVLLESFSSEQAARMVTMQEASERAGRALQDLIVRYNRLRRESITSDLTSVLGAARTRKQAEHA